MDSAGGAGERRELGLMLGQFPLVALFGARFDLRAGFA
jgi:hypothetical protein